MLIECGYRWAVAADGTEYTFLPSFARIAALGSPKEIVSLYAGLHGPRAADDAAYILATLCEQDDATPLIGPPGRADEAGTWMAADQQINLALQLMHHGIIGTARPNKKGSGGYSDSFNVADYIASACVHLGLSRADAEQLSMTEYQTMYAMKFPDSMPKEVPSREAYKAFMEKVTKVRNV